MPSSGLKVSLGHIYGEMAPGAAGSACLVSRLGCCVRLWGTVLYCAARLDTCRLQLSLACSLLASCGTMPQKLTRCLLILVWQQLLAMQCERRPARPLRLSKTAAAMHPGQQVLQRDEHKTTAMAAKHGRGASP